MIPPTGAVRDPAPRVRLSGILAGLSHALDLTEGHPRGHATRCALIGLRLGQALGLKAAEQTELLYALLLKDAGCSSNAAIVSDLFGGSDHEVKRAVWLRDWRRVPAQIAYAWEHVGRGSGFAARLRRFGRLARLGRRGSGERIFTVRCERGAEIARMIGLPERVAGAIRAMDEHWDGGGYPYGHSRDQAPLFARIIGLAQVLEIFWSEGGPGYAMEVACERRGRWFDPEIVDALEDVGRKPAFWSGLAHARLEPDVLGSIPSDLEIAADDDRLDRIAHAFALIVDAKSPFTFAHSRRVAEYAAAVNTRLGEDGVDAVRLRRAALLHDLGKLTIPNSILDKPGALDADEWAVVRRHPGFTLSILQRVPAFRQFADDAANHHEWMDGKGYSLGLSGERLSTTARILAVADVIDALSADRPYRKGMPPDRVRAILESESGSHFDPVCVEACTADVISAAGMGADPAPPGRHDEWASTRTGRRVE
ncbi:MAG TPA: HD domain-containing phosphohydrolase [Vicinamibacterales bacterium]|nr:HD domain-containing phosphohydrolase [Vicinamibacterales bacterium]